MIYPWNKNTLKGYLITRPSLFDEILFDFWKISMSNLIKSIEFIMCNMIEVKKSHPSQLVKGMEIDIPFSSWTLEERELTQPN